MECRPRLVERDRGDGNVFDYDRNCAGGGYVARFGRNDGYADLDRRHLAAGVNRGDRPIAAAPGHGVCRIGRFQRHRQRRRFSFGQLQGGLTQRNAGRRGEHAHFAVS